MTVGKKLVTVFGGTGSQGSAVVRSLLSHKDQAFGVRVITRDPTSTKAQGVANLGATLVKANGYDKAQMVAAFQGSWGVFINSNSDIHVADDDLSAPGVYDLDITVFDAAEAAGVQHVVYSSGANTHRATKCRVTIPGFECKHYAEEYCRAYKHFTTFTAILPGSFMECWLDKDFCTAFGGFPWYADGKECKEGNAKNKTIKLCVPPYGGDGKMPWVNVQQDLGDIVHGIFLDPHRYDKARVQAISELISFEDLVGAFTTATGTHCEYSPLESWTQVGRDGSFLRDEIRRIFFFTNFCGGKWFAEHESDITASRECKRAASKAQGKAEAEGKLVSFQQFFHVGQAQIG